MIANLSNFSTGYFGHPGRTGGLVHAVENDKPICGTHIAEGAEYQWCSRGLHTPYIECEKCKKLLKDLQPSAEVKLAVEKYVRRIRNSLKYVYANNYAAWVLNGRIGVEPVRVHGLSYMAAQAVRLEIEDLVK